MGLRITSLTFIILASLLSLGQTPELQQPSSLITLQSTLPSKYALVVDKSTRKVSIWQQADSGFKKIAEYDADIGKGFGNKERLGDHKTPEGIYFFVKTYEAKELDFEKFGVKAFATNYPNLFDYREGKTGSGIWLHAIPDHVGLDRGSRGCVVVRNEAIKEISQFITLNETPMIIYDKVPYSNSKDLLSTKQEAQGFLEAWKTSWEAKDLEKYMSHYSLGEFKSLGMNFDKWKQFKMGLNKVYGEIKVKISDPMIIAFGDKIVLRFYQDYKSDLHKDFGEKTLYLKKTNNKLGIIAEQWEALSEELSLKIFTAQESEKRSLTHSN